MNAFTFAMALALAAFAASALLIPPLCRIAPRVGLLDHPGGRKRHACPVPLVGGVAMMAVFLVCFFAFGLFRTVSVYLPAAAALMAVGGLLDDRLELGPVPKLGVQIVAALVLAQAGGALLLHLGELVRPGLLMLGALALPFSVFAIVGVMNAVNMADGIDGLAGGLSLVAALAFAWCAADAGKSGPFWVAILLAGVLAGFLLYNLRWTPQRRASVFMGDSGSYAVGLVLAWIAIMLAMDEKPALAPMTAVWILGIPLADTVVLMLRRTLRGRWPFGADTGHLHHLLMRRGLSQAQVTWLLLCVAAVMAVAGITAFRSGIPDYVMFYGYGALWIVLYVSTSFATRPGPAGGHARAPGRMRGGARPDSFRPAR
ncbi:MAG: MraY family glycosyltransferase [Burkholderiales bacterium]|nr:MraY family glycosyltransferase [Burkholderiales bacterium]